MTSKEAVFTMKLETGLRDPFMAEARTLDRPSSLVMRALMRELIVHETHRLIDEVDEPDEVVWGLARGHTARRWPALH